MVVPSQNLQHPGSFGPHTLLERASVHPTRDPLLYSRTHSNMHLSPPPTSQNVWAFNQPLNFDTSKVTDMSNMFQVPGAHSLSRV